MALLTLSNEGAPAHFFHLMEAPTMRLPNVKMLLCWSSRMQIYGFVENLTFLEQFVSRGVPAQFSNLGVLAHFWSIRLVHVFFNFLEFRYPLASICLVMIWYKSMGVNARHRAKADFSCNEHSELAKGVLRAKTGMGVHPNVSTGPKQNIKREPTVRD